MHQNKVLGKYEISIQCKSCQQMVECARDLKRENTVHKLSLQMMANVHSLHEKHENIDIICYLIYNVGYIHIHSP